MKVGFGVIYNSLALLMASSLLLTGCQDDGNSNGHTSHSESSVQDDFERGPHGGRFLRSGDSFSAELQIYESGTPPKFRFYGYLGAKILPASELKAQVTLKRLGAADEKFDLVSSGDFLTSDTEVTEPHSFDVAVTAEYSGKVYTWSYSSPEGRVSIPGDVAERSGIRSEHAASREISKTFRIRGKILPSEHRIAHIIPRFSGLVREGRKHIGDPVQKGEVLAIIESNQSLQPFEVRSQISGTVINGHLIVGEFVPENQWVYIVADLSEVWADFFVPLRDRSAVKLGQKVLISGVGQGHLVEGIVSYIAPYADEKSQAQLVRAVIPNQNGALLPGMFIAGDLIVEQIKAPIAVKRSAIQRFRDWNVVFVRFGEVYEARPVTLGQGDDQYVAVLGGLSSNDEYVSENSFLIKADILKSGASHDH
jgi:cobalt-zinc-cadmium efflux system membrane fusion protein